MSLDYLGINGLFTNVLLILSFAELGIGQAIVFNLYKPLAENNQERIKTLMLFYKQCYRVVAIVIIVVGLSIIPFMDFFIKECPNISENLIFIYLLFLTNTVSSYFFVYKKSLITADQKEYVIIFWSNIINYIQILLQIVFLLITHNYIVYIMIQIGCTIFNNIFLAHKADRKYPFLKEKNVNKLEKAEKNKIFKDVKALFLYKFGSIALNGTDNLIISAMIGVTVVGLTSNYVLIFTSVTAIMGKIIHSFVAPVGNLNATSDVKKQEKVFNELFMMTFYLIGLTAIGLFLLSSDFVTVFFGAEYTLDTLVVFAMALHLYVNSTHNTAHTYRTTMGLFVKARWSPAIAAVINIAASIILCNWIGLAGIFFATAIARLSTTSWIDPYLIYKTKFNKSPMIYFIKYALYLVVVGCVGYVNYLALGLINIEGILGFIVKFAICVTITNILFILIFFKTKVFKSLRVRIIDFIKINVLKRKANEKKV